MILKFFKKKNASKTIGADSLGPWFTGASNWSVGTEEQKVWFGCFDGLDGRCG